MALSIKTLDVASGVCGSCIGIPLIVTKGNFMATTTTQDSTDLSSSPSNPTEGQVSQDDSTNVVSGSCGVVNSLTGLNLESLFTGLQIEKDNYYTLSCTKTDKNGNSILPNNWTGVFSKSFFKEGDALKEGDQINVAMNVTPKNLGEERPKHGTVIFTGNKFASPITGEYNGKTSW